MTEAREQWLASGPHRTRLTEDGAACACGWAVTTPHDQAEQAAYDHRAPGRLQSEDWWITTGPKLLNGRRKLGPFVSYDLALEVRVYVEKVEQRDDLWVVDGEDIPDA